MISHFKRNNKRGTLPTQTGNVAASVVLMVGTPAARESMRESDHPIQLGAEAIFRERSRLKLGQGASLDTGEIAVRRFRKDERGAPNRTVVKRDLE